METSSIDSENNTGKEVSLIYDQDDKSECLDKLLIPPSDEEMIDACFSYEYTCLTDSSQAQPLINQTGAFLSNDKITRDICQPDTLFPLNNDRLHIIDSTNLESETAVQNVIHTAIEQFDEYQNDVSYWGSGIHQIQPIPTNSNQFRPTPSPNNFGQFYKLRGTPVVLPPSRFEYVANQIVQDRLAFQLIQVLQFVHDVHPYQKTQHDMDTLDEYARKYLAPYVMRLQGLKTSADKGKSIPLQIKIPLEYLSVMKQKEYSLNLKIAIVHEKKVNSKRYFYAFEDIQFLPGGTNKYTDAVNPIQFNLNSTSIKSDGILGLALRLINKSSQPMSEQFNSKLLHELDENVAMNLHPTPHDPRFFRILIVLVKDHHIIWDTLCLSDYVRPSKIIDA
ncbi:unnamed protein product [Adineta steineri]|uniref:Uncharacterized protein n=1 Tax=Adineta steineri TaxID=433720 RepID=A0A814QNE8_9BILA|nr:unnamed protein product [Adineta steineri]CAF1209764.1 unnamed protein product [Adineta steineri]CAF4063081.1 unnamed protein product [Adineta steineri]CAF4073637.1 unnamed protein product [Adineta steineri]